MKVYKMYPYHISKLKKSITILHHKHPEVFQTSEFSNISDFFLKWVKNMKNFIRNAKQKQYISLVFSEFYFILFFHHNIKVTLKLMN